jgi:hypothetical protein
MNGEDQEANQTFAEALLCLGKDKRQKNNFAVVWLAGINIESYKTLRQMNDKLTRFVYDELSWFTEKAKPQQSII